MKIPLELAPGIVADDTDFSTGGWRDCDNVRFWRGKPETVKGWESLSLTPLGGVCRTVWGWSDAENLLNFAFGCHNGLTVWQNGSQADVTPSGFVAGQIDGTGSTGYGTGAFGVGDYGEPSSSDYFPLTWSFGAVVGELYANPRNQGIFRWANDTATEAALLSGAPAQVTFTLCTWTAQIMAFGCTDTGDTFNPSCIRWSEIADGVSGSLENWSPGGTSTAGQFYLEGNGRIIGARAVGRYIFVWTDSELHLGTFTDTWSFERVAGGCGLCGPNAAVVVNQRAYWLSPDLQFWFCDLGGVPAILPCPIRSDFLANASASQNDKIVAASTSEFGEIQWAYADVRDGTGYEVSRIVRMSVIDGAWSRSVLARTAYVDSNPGPSPVGVTYDGIIYWHERGESADGAVLESFLESGGVYLDAAERVLMCRGVWPDFRDQMGPVSLTVSSRFYPQDEWTDHGPYVCAKGANKVDFFATGRIFKIRLESSSTPMTWRLGKPEFDVVVTGER